MKLRERRTRSEISCSAFSFHSSWRRKILHSEPQQTSRKDLVLSLRTGTRQQSLTLRPEIALVYDHQVMRMKKYLSSGGKTTRLSTWLRGIPSSVDNNVCPMSQPQTMLRIRWSSKLSSMLFSMLFSMHAGLQPRQKTSPDGGRGEFCCAGGGHV